MTWSSCCRTCHRPRRNARPCEQRTSWLGCPRAPNGSRAQPCLPTAVFARSVAFDAFEEKRTAPCQSVGVTNRSPQIPDVGPTCLESLRVARHEQNLLRKVHFIGPLRGLSMQASDSVKKYAGGVG